MTFIPLRRRSAGYSNTAHDAIALRIIRGFLNGLERSRQRRALALLSDALLRDIDLTRRDVRREIGEPFWRA